MGAIGLAALAYAMRVEPFWLSADDVSLDVPHLPSAFDGITILHLSDFHAIPGQRTAHEIIERAARIPADLVCMTGDYGDNPTYAPIAAHLLAGARGRLGTFAVLGNHDAEMAAQQGTHRFSSEVASRVGALLEAGGVTVLRNESALLEVDGDRFWVVGVDDPHTFFDDVDRAYRDVPPGEPSLFLSHSWEPVPRAVERGAILALSGHTHGGQVRMPPFDAPIANARRRPPRVGGMQCVHGVPLHISRGLGSTIKLRFFARPDALRITLRRALPEPVSPS